MSGTPRARLRLALLFGLFAAPPVAAILVYHVFPGWIPQGRVNYGTLLEPVRAVPTLALRDVAGAPVAELYRGRWVLLQLGGAECGASCRERAYLSRQVWHALADKRKRVQRVFVAPDARALAAAHAALAPGDHWDLTLLQDAGTAGARAPDFFQADDPDALFLIDPAGNWVLVYAGPIEHKGLHKDLKRLLRFSRIG